jgi:hypothetical protein
VWWYPDPSVQIDSFGFGYQEFDLDPSTVNHGGIRVKLETFYSFVFNGGNL